MSGQDAASGGVDVIVSHPTGCVTAMLRDDASATMTGGQPPDRHAGPAINFRALSWFALAGAVALIFARWDLIYGYSVDLGLHFALVNALFEQLSGGELKEAELGVMIHYPRGAHWLAAALSTFTMSPLLSMNVLALLALYAAYVAVALLLLDDDSTVTLIRFALALVATWWLSGQQAALGYQVILNFFFPQLLGDAAVLWAIYVVSRAELWALPAASRALALVATTWLLSYVQPLAAAQFGGTVVLYSLLAATLGSGKVTIRWRLLVGPAVLAALIIAATLLHPAFRTMSGIAAHDGYLRFGEWLRPGRYVLLAIVALASAALLVGIAVRGRTEARRALLLAAATTTGASLLILQKLLLAYGIGSEYAVSKHVFFVVATTALALAYASPALLPRGREARRFPSVGAVVPIIFAFMAIGLVFSRASTWRQDLRPVLEYQSYAEHYYRFHRPIDGNGNFVSLNTALTPIFNHLVSLGTLRLPYNVAMNSITTSNIMLETPVKYAIVSSRVLDPEALRRCAVGLPASSSYAAVDRACFVSSLSSLPPGILLKTGANERGTAYLTQGWSVPEAWGTWSASATARIAFTVAPQADVDVFTMQLTLIPFIAGSRRHQAFTVLVDGKEVGSYSVADSTPSNLAIPIEGAGSHVIDVRIQDPVSPKQLGLSAHDDRKLGIGVLEMRLLPIRAN